VIDSFLQEFLLGKVDLRCGDLCDLEQLQFMLDADVTLVNNAFEIFSARSGSRKKGPSLDDYIASIFARMKPGARMVTFYPLPLGLSRKDANERRKRQPGRHCNDNASFFECEPVNLGPNSCSWTDKDMVAYLYKRVENSVDNQATVLSMFLCEKCPNQIPTRVICDETCLLIENCVVCGTKRPITGGRKARPDRKQNV